MKRILRQARWLPVGLLVCVPLASGTNSLQAKDAVPQAGAAPADSIRLPLSIPGRERLAKLSKPDYSPKQSTSKYWHSVTVRSGDTLTSIFRRLGLDAGQVQAILSNGGAARTLEKLRPGQDLRVRIRPAGVLQELEYHISATDSVRARRSGKGFGVTSVHRVPEKRIAHASGTIDLSLFLAARKAGLSHHTTMELSRLFGWDIDFALDIRRGDQFTVLYEELYLDGDKIGEGDIVAAEFVNQGRAFQAVRFVTPAGRIDYYTPQGKSMRKAFLRTPVEFSRISSRFNLKRKHPILNRIKAHKGVDYAAPRGTPVKATGDGKIIYRGTKGGYGKTVVLEHGGRYRTLYAHLSRYGRGQHSGQRIRQGQTIGYVGATGLATGPHLHYEFHVNGVHRNPLTVSLPAAKPVPSRYRADFNRQAQSLLARLNLVKETTVARLQQ